MYIKKTTRSFISVLLTLAMVFTMFPTAGFAVDEEDTVDLTVFKNMQLYSAVNHRPISTYFNAESTNYYQTPATLGSGGEQPLEWMLLSFSIQLSQPVNLSLYKLSEGYDDDPIILEYDEDPDAQEEFLSGERIGYLAGIRVEDNVEADPDRGDGYYKYVEIGDDVFCDMLMEHINSTSELTVMKEALVYGFDGEPLIVQRSASRGVDDTGDEQADDPYLRAGELPLMDGKIQNYLLWNGMLASEDGEPISYDYTGGKYVIVLEPTTEETKVYNSFLAFEVSTTAHPDELLAEEYPGLYYEFPGDPVNLLTGSFSWSYTDLALYGKYDLPFTLYYESADAGSNYGLGCGFSSDYTVQLEVDTLYAKVTLPGGKTIYFDYTYDGSYRAKAGSSFSFNRISGGYQLINNDGTVYTFGADRNIYSISTLDGNELLFSYSGGRLASVSNRSGTLSFSYNGEGNIQSVSDSVGRTVTLSYSGDYLSAIDNADGDDLRFTYDAAGYLAQISNFNNEVYLSNEYDGQGRVVRQYVQDEGTFLFTYDSSARRNTCTGDNGYYLSIVYDELGRIIESSNSEGTKYISYNKLNQRTSETDREGNVTEYAYDDNGNVIRITYADGLSESYTYNAANQVTGHTDRSGNTVSYAYDANANLVAVTDARGNTTRYAYDDAHNVTSVTDALGSTTSFSYDDAGNCLTETDALGNVTTYVYDAQGRLLSAADAAGAVTSYSYTDAGKLVKITDPNGN